MKKAEKLTLSVSEAAAELGCSERYLYMLLHRPDCTFCLRLGRKMRVVRSEFERWICDQARSSTHAYSFDRPADASARRIPR